MKKLIYIFTALLLSFSLTACTPEGMPPEDDSLPTIDIVERSQLLDIVNIDYIASEELKARLARSDMELSMDNFQITGDYTGTFNLNMHIGETVFTDNVECILSYDKQTVDNRDEFSNVKVYWGDIHILGDDIIVTNLDNSLVHSASENGVLKNNIDLSFLNDIDGCVMDVVTAGDKYIYVYYSENDCGIAIYNADGQLAEKVTLADTGITNSFASVSDMFTVASRPKAFVTENGLVYITGIVDTIGGTDAFLYDMSKGINYGRNDIFVNSDLVVDNFRYMMHRFSDENTGKGVFIAAQADDNGILRCVEFSRDGRIMNFARYTGQRLSLEEDRLRFDSAGAGLVLTVDMETGETAYKMNITEDILGEKLHTSLDHEYSLYQFAPFNYPNMTMHNVALKNEKTGGTKYIGFMNRIGGEMDVAETGFFSNGEVYLLTSSDFEIFDRDMENTKPVFVLSDNFPLGMNAVQNGFSRHLCAVRRNADNSFYVVYYDYDVYNSDRYTEGNVMSQLKNTYQIAHLDKTGKMITSHDTGINVQLGTSPVNMYLRNNKLYLAVMIKYTDDAYIKFTFDTLTGKTEITQPYKA